LPTANIYLTQSISDIIWETNIPRLQDNMWMLNLSKKKEWSWKIFPEIVGVWYHHDNDRISHQFGPSRPAHWYTKSLINLYKELDITNRLSIERKKYILHRIKAYSHHNFPNSPIFCSKLLFMVYGISNNSLIFVLLRLLKEWLFFPHRFVRNELRVFVDKQTSYSKYIKNEEFSNES